MTSAMLDKEPVCKGYLTGQEVGNMKFFLRVGCLLLVTGLSLGSPLILDTVTTGVKNVVDQIPIVNTLLLDRKTTTMPPTVASSTAAVTEALIGGTSSPTEAAATTATTTAAATEAVNGTTEVVAGSVPPAEGTPSTQPEATAAGGPEAPKVEGKSGGAADSSSEEDKSSEEKDGEGRSLINVPNRGCAPGQKVDKSGRCRSIF